MSFGALDLLTRHTQESGLLKGKVLSDFTIKVPSRIDHVLYRHFSLPDTNHAFRQFCKEPLALGFRKPHRLLPTAHGFIESGYRGLKEARALLIELVCRTGSQIFLEIKARGAADASKFGGREAQARFDNLSHLPKPSVEGYYRTYQYVLVGTIFSSLDVMARYMEANHMAFLGHRPAAKNTGGLTLNTAGSTRPISRRIPEKWFSGRKNHWLPRALVDLIDDDGLALMFPPTFIERLKRKEVHKGVLRLTDEQRKTMLMKVREEYRFNPARNDEELLTLYEEIPDAPPIDYERGHAMSVEIVCDLAVEIRVLRGDRVLKEMLEPSLW